MYRLIVTGKLLTILQLYNYLKAKNANDGKPEYRLPLLIVGAVVSPIGILIYAWTAEYQTLWVGPDFGVGIFGFGVVLTMICISGYIIECFPQVAASAVAAATCLRSLTAFVSAFNDRFLLLLTYGRVLRFVHHISSKILAMGGEGLCWPALL